MKTRLQHDQYNALKYIRQQYDFESRAGGQRKNKNVWLPMLEVFVDIHLKGVEDIDNFFDHLSLYHGVQETDNLRRVMGPLITRKFKEKQKRPLQSEQLSVEQIGQAEKFNKMHNIQWPTDLVAINKMYKDKSRLFHPDKTDNPVQKQTRMKQFPLLKNAYRLALQRAK